MVKLGYDTPGSGPAIAPTTPVLEALVKEHPLDVEVLPQGQDPLVSGTLCSALLALLFPVLTRHFTV